MRASLVLQVALCPPGGPFSIGYRQLPGDRFHRILRAQEIHDHEVFSDAFELHLVELPKNEPGRSAGPASKLAIW